MAFDKGSISVQAGSSVIMNFNNKDGGIPHNFALYTNSSATTPIFVGQTIKGPATITYKFNAPTTAGTYFFRCDLHPTSMTGSFIVTAVSSGGGAGGY
jgi:plastocyanin